MRRMMKKMRRSTCMVRPRFAFMGRATVGARRCWMLRAVRLVSRSFSFTNRSRTDVISNSSWCSCFDH
jgi:hypothetical protein